MGGFPGYVDAVAYLDALVAVSRLMPVGIDGREAGREAIRPTSADTSRMTVPARRGPRYAASRMSVST
jgi:hypothetical protein